MRTSARTRSGRALGLAIALLALLSGLACCGQALAERPAAASLLPDSTVLVFSVADAPDVAQRFMNTAAGRMSEDPQLKPLVKDLYGSITEAVASLKDEVGLSLTEILTLPQGEMTFALIAPEAAPPAAVVLLDVGDQLSNARRLLKRGTEEMEKQNAARSEEAIGETTLVVYDGVGPRKRKVAYFEKDDTLVAGSDLEVLKGLLGAWDGRAEGRLKENEKYAAVMRKCRGTKDLAPQFFWYFDPIALMKNIGQDNTQVRLATATLPALGLDGVMAMGGSVALDAGQFDSVAHFHLLLDNPRDGIVEMIALESGEVRPESWVPADVASYATFHWRFQTTFDNLREIIDSFQGEGAVDDNLRRTVQEPTGIDLERDIIRSLEGRVTHFTRIDRQAPVSLRSNSWCWGLKLRDTEPVEETLGKLSARFEENIRSDLYAGNKFYQAIPPRPRRAQSKPNEARPVDLDRPRPPEPCFGVVKDYLIITDRPELFHKVVSLSNNPEEALADTLDFKLIASKIVRQCGGAKPSLISFDRPEEVFRWAYDMINAQRTRDRLREAAADNPFFMSVEAALEKNPLPPFEVLQQYLAPGGAMIVDDETGIHYTAFTLRRKND